MFAAKPERAVRDPAWNQWANDTSSPTDQIVVTTSSAQQLLTVYGCVTRIADVFGTMPVDHLTKFGGVRADMSPRAAWLDQPNPETSWPTFAKQYVWSRCLDGNAFIKPIRNPAGRVVEMWMLDPASVSLTRPHPGAPVSVTVGGHPFKGELLHVPGYMPAGHVRGVNPIEAARIALGLGLSAQEYGAGFFKNSAIPSVVVLAKGEVTADQREAVKEGWNDKHRGPRKSGGVAVVGGDATVQQLTVAPEQAQFLETQRFSAATIAANLFKVPPYLAGVAVDGSSLTYQSLPDMYDDLVRSACMPLMSDLEHAISLHLLPQPQYVKLNADVWLRPATKTRYDTHKVGIDAGFLTDDEARALEDLPPLTDVQREQIKTMRKPAPAAAPTTP